MTTTKEGLITDPRERKKLREQMGAEYKRLTGISVVLMERPPSNRGTNLKEYRSVAKRHLLEVSCKYFQVPAEVIRSKSRKADIVKCRQMIVYLLRKIGTKVEEIKDITGYTDHSIVTSTMKLIDGYLKVDEQYKEEYYAYQEYCLTELHKRKRKNPPALTPEQIEAIRYTIKKVGMDKKKLADVKKELAEIYGVHITTIYKYANIKNQQNSKIEWVQLKN